MSQQPWEDQYTIEVRRLAYFVIWWNRYQASIQTFAEAANTKYHAQ